MNERATPSAHLPTRDIPCELLALDTRTGQLKWRLELEQWGGVDMAVGIDNIIYIAGMMAGPFGSTPIAAAVIDHGDRGEIKWGPTMLERRAPRNALGGRLGIARSPRTSRHDLRQHHRAARCQCARREAASHQPADRRDHRVVGPGASRARLYRWAQRCFGGCGGRRLRRCARPMGEPWSAKKRAAGCMP